MKTFIAIACLSAIIFTGKLSIAADNCLNLSGTYECTSTDSNQPYSVKLSTDSSSGTSVYDITVSPNPGISYQADGITHVLSSESTRQVTCNTSCTNSEVKVLEVQTVTAGDTTSVITSGMNFTVQANGFILNLEHTQLITPSSVGQVSITDVCTRSP